MKIKILLGLILIAWLINSCDCPNMHYGHVFDKFSKKPISGVSVMVIFKDTAVNTYGFKYDTISIRQRRELMKTEKEQYKWWDPNDNKDRLCTNAPLFTDSLGLYKIDFMTGNCPNDVRLLFYKTGYAPYIYKAESTVDSLDIFLIKDE